MRQSIILSDEYEQLFIHEAQKTGLIELLPSYADDLYDPEELNDARSWFNARLDNQVEKKRDLLRIILLSDEIILSQAPGEYDYQKLENNEGFKIIPFEDFYYNDPIRKDGHEQHAENLKFAILPVAEKELRRYFRNVPEKINYSEFVSDLYDTVLLRKKLPRKYEEIITTNKEIFDLKNAAYFRYADSINMPKVLRRERYFLTFISELMVTLFEDLCWQLQISSDNESTIMNCKYQLANIGCQSFNGEPIPAMDAYKILRIEYGKLMGTLPEVNSIQEVIHMKEKRRSDLHNLKQELSRLEYEIRNSGSISAVEKAAKDISKASKALSIGNTATNVNEWTARFLLPLTVASLFSQNLEISLGLSVITSIELTATMIGHHLAHKNNWMELLI